MVKCDQCGGYISMVQCGHEDFQIMVCSKCGAHPCDEAELWDFIAMGNIAVVKHGRLMWEGGIPK